MDLGFRISIAFYSRFSEVKDSKALVSAFRILLTSKNYLDFERGGGLQKKFLRPFGPQFGLRIRGADPPDPSSGSVTARDEVLLLIEIKRSIIVYPSGNCPSIPPLSQH